MYGLQTMDPFTALALFVAGGLAAYLITRRDNRGARFQLPFSLMVAFFVLVGYWGYCQNHDPRIWQQGRNAKLTTLKP